MRLKTPQRKGSDYEREVGKLIERWLDGTARRVPCSGALPWMKGDLICRGNELEGWLLECKRREAAHVWKWIDKAEHQAERHPWMVFFRRSGGKTRVLLDAEDLLRVLSMLQEARQEGGTRRPPCDR